MAAGCGNGTGAATVGRWGINTTRWETRWQTGMRESGAKAMGRDGSGIQGVAGCEVSEGSSGVGRVGGHGDVCACRGGGGRGGCGRCAPRARGARGLGEGMPRNGVCDGTGRDGGRGRRVGAVSKGGGRVGGRRAAPRRPRPMGMRRARITRGLSWLRPALCNAMLRHSLSSPVLHRARHVTLAAAGLVRVGSPTHSGARSRRPPRRQGRMPPPK